MPWLYTCLLPKAATTTNPTRQFCTSSWADSFFTLIMHHQADTSKLVVIRRLAV